MKWKIWTSGLFSIHGNISAVYALEVWLIYLEAYQQTFYSHFKVFYEHYKEVMGERRIHKAPQLLNKSTKFFLLSLDPCHACFSRSLLLFLLQSKLGSLLESFYVSGFQYVDPKKWQKRKTQNILRELSTQIVESNNYITIVYSNRYLKHGMQMSLTLL